MVENKPGGGGVIAYSYVAKSPPDGYLMLIAPASFTMGPHLSRNPLYNPVTEFAPIDLVADVPFVMVVPPNLPVKTVQEFIALAKNSPNKLTFGSVGVGTPQHLGGELFKMHAGVDLIHVPFRGATAAHAGSAGRAHRHVHRRHQFAAAADQGRQAARARRGRQQAHRRRCRTCRPLPRRACPASRSAPASAWWRRPARRPTSSRRSTARSARSSPTPGFHERMAAIGVDVVGTTPAAYAKIISDDYEKWGKVVAAAGIKPE